MGTIVTSALASWAAAACGSVAAEAPASTLSGDAAPPTSSDAGDPDAAAIALPPGFTPLACTDGTWSKDPLAVIVPASPVDYVESRTEGAPARASDGGVSGPGPITVTGSHGTRCSGAADMAACASAVAAVSHPFLAGCEVPVSPTPCVTSYLVYTRKDEVGSVVSPEDLRAFLADFSIKENAFDYAVDRGHGLSCLPGQASGYRDTGDGYDLVVWDQVLLPDGCTFQTHRRVIHVSRSGVITTLEDQAIPLASAPGLCASARLSADLVYEGPTDIRSAASFFEAAAHLEMASVASFETLARELEAHGAPPALVARARAAATDEARHGVLTSGLAQHFGGTPRPPRPRPIASRSLEAMAIENATEGGVRETFGALLASWQAETATDARVRSAMRAIAEDEIAHAVLAEDIATWAHRILTPESRRRVDDAKRGAVEALARDVMTATVPWEVRSVVGLPQRATAMALFERAHDALWSETAR